MLTVDTEALPKRTSQNHVKRLIWGEHDEGTAGIREICSIGDEFNIKHTFFVDMCGAYQYPEEMREVVRWLDRNGQDVQLHSHPEVLPRCFWTENGLEVHPRYMNEYSRDARAEFVIKHFGGQISEITGKEILAYRAGSFRWNACSIRALKTANIPLSFNNSMRAYRAGRCTFSEPTNLPYAWSNGVIEVPITEKRVPPKRDRKEKWACLSYPESSYFRFRARGARFLSALFNTGPAFAVFLLHSWSLLHLDERRHAIYVDERPMEGYRDLLARVAKHYDVITTRDFLDLHASGKIVATHTVDVDKAALGRVS
jgi:hypothetical protein